MILERSAQLYPWGPWISGNIAVVLVPVRQAKPCWIWMNIVSMSPGNGTTIAQSMTQPCAYFMGYSVFDELTATYLNVLWQIVCFHGWLKDNPSLFKLNRKWMLMSGLFATVTACWWAMHSRLVLCVCCGGLFPVPMLPFVRGLWWPDTERPGLLWVSDLLTKWSNSPHQSPVSTRSSAAVDFSYGWCASHREGQCQQIWTGRLHTHIIIVKKPDFEI